MLLVAKRCYIDFDHDGCNAAEPQPAGRRRLEGLAVACVKHHIDTHCCLSRPLYVSSWSESAVHARLRCHGEKFAVLVVLRPNCSATLVQARP